jgi:hypothetical protein
MYDGCPYTGDIFTFKNRVTVHKIIFTLKTVTVSFSYSISGFFYDTTFRIFFSKIFNLRLPFHFLSIGYFLYCFQDLSLAAPSAALAAPGRPYLSTAGAPVAAARVAAHQRSSPLVVVVGAGEPEQCRRRDGSGRGSRRLPSCRASFFGGRRGWHDGFKP